MNDDTSLGLSMLYRQRFLYLIEAFSPSDASSLTNCLVGEVVIRRRILGSEESGLAWDEKVTKMPSNMTSSMVQPTRTKCFHETPAAVQTAGLFEAVMEPFSQQR
jgi:hypothetical protein